MADAAPVGDNLQMKRKPKAALVEIAPGFFADPREVRRVAARAKKRKQTK